MTTEDVCPRCKQPLTPDAGHCYLCCDDIIPGDPESLLNHLRNLHPDQYGEGPQRWPDGQIVFTDETDYTADDIEER